MYIPVSGSGFVGSKGRYISGGAVPSLLSSVKQNTLGQKVSGSGLIPVTKSNVVGGITQEQIDRKIPSKVGHEFKSFMSPSGMVEKPSGGSIGSLVNLLSAVRVGRPTAEKVAKRRNIKFQPF
jgi:hypothetical protein